MGKRLFLLIIASIIGVVLNPISLTASDSVDITGINNDNIVETVIEEKPEFAPEVTSGTAIARANTTSSTATLAVARPANNIDIFGRSIEVVEVGDTMVDSGNHVNKYGAKFLYGHNSGAVFGSLHTLGIGSTFTLNLHGNSVTYRVTEIGMYEKTNDYAITDVNTSQTYAMGAIASNAKGHALALMTCAGTMYSGGDASHRLVVYADSL